MEAVQQVRDLKAEIVDIEQCADHVRDNKRIFKQKYKDLLYGTREQDEQP